MNCSNCGTLNDVNSKFCIKCGQSLNSIQTNNVEVPIQNQQIINEQPVQQPVQQSVQQSVQQPVQQSVQQPVQQSVQ